MYLLDFFIRPQMAGNCQTQFILPHSFFVHVIMDLFSSATGE